MDNYVLRSTRTPAPISKTKKKPTRIVVSVVPLIGNESVSGVGVGVLDGFRVGVAVGIPSVGNKVGVMLVGRVVGTVVFVGIGPVG